jgi:hypothetical protein
MLLKAKTPHKKTKSSKVKNLWANPSYRNMLNLYESKYPQGKPPKPKKKP